MTVRRLACPLILLGVALATPARAGGYPGYVQQQQAYAQPYQQRQYVEKVYYQFLPVLTPGEYYGGQVAGQLKQQRAQAAQQAVQADLASRVDRLAAAVEGLQRSIGQPGPLPQPQPPITPTTPAQPPPVPVPVPPQPTEPAEPAGADATVPADVLALLGKHCLKCHTAPAKAGGGYAIFDDADTLAAIGPLDLLAIDQQVYSGAMPPDKPLSKDEYGVLRAWIANSHDEIMAAIKACAKNAATTPKGN